MWPKTTKTHLDVTFPAENAVLNYSNTEPEITLHRTRNYIAQDKKNFSAQDKKIAQKMKKSPAQASYS